MIKITIEKNDAEQRLDRFLKKYYDNAPLSLIYKMIRKDVKVNGKREKEEYVLKVGDELSVYMLESEAEKLRKPIKVVKAKRQFKIAYEDDNILIAEKPYGLLTHGDQHEKKNHLANQVIDYLIEEGSYNPRLEKTFTPAPVNRLDRNTTGLVVFGKNAAALKELTALIREKDAVSKCYMTIVNGRIPAETILRDKMIKDELHNRVKVIDLDSEEGKVMETVVRPLKYSKVGNRYYTLTEVEIITGRTHQIRVHLAKEGFPVIGDVKYGAPNVMGLSTQLLHAYKLTFNRTGETLKYLEGKSFMAEPPEDFRRIESKLFRD